MNRLYFGDNLAVLHRHVPDASVDFVYLDPPFNSKARYNVLFRSPKEDATSAQAAAFLDFWSWGAEAEEAYHRLLTEIGGPTASLIKSLRSALGESDMMAYLVMMAVRLECYTRANQRACNLASQAAPFRKESGNSFATRSSDAIGAIDL